MLISSFDILFFLASQYFPVLISTPCMSSFLHISIIFKSGSTKSIIFIAPFKLFIILLTFVKFFLRFNPPSVVNSCLFSGTRVTVCGFILLAILTISGVGAISRFKGNLMIFL